MKQYTRKLQLDNLPGTSAFLLGPRQVGKSTYLRERFINSIYIDLLDSSVYIRYLKDPSLFRSEIRKSINDNLNLKNLPIIVDEIQKLPILLNEVHKLIEEDSLQFILSGSSARKLVRSGSNMLGGRAVRKRMFPLVSAELEEYNLLDIINKGTIPNHYLSNNTNALLDAYIDSYLKEEIKQEGLVRNLRPFTLFLESASFSNGELINSSNIGRELGIDGKTVSEYYQILVDTLLGYFIYPYRSRSKRLDIASTPKFYFFDVGVGQKLKGHLLSKTKGAEFGHAFEHFIFTELYAYMSYSNKHDKITYWRNRNGYEVDFILGDTEVAIEVKSKQDIQTRDIKGLNKFSEEYTPKKSIVISTVDQSRLLENGIEIFNYKEFLKQLWQGRII